jgi:hypothetical protein
MKPPRDARLSAASLWAALVGGLAQNLLTTITAAIATRQITVQITTVVVIIQLGMD